MHGQSFRRTTEEATKQARLVWWDVVCHVPTRACVSMRSLFVGRICRHWIEGEGRRLFTFRPSTLFGSSYDTASSHLAFPSKLWYFADGGWIFSAINQQHKPSVFSARMAELVDAQDLKSCILQRVCGFKSRSGHKRGNTLAITLYPHRIRLPQFRIRPEFFLPP